MNDQPEIRPLGIIMLVHTALHRASQVARTWANAGCPVVIHVDETVSEQKFLSFQSELKDEALISFCERHACNWGGWGLVSATQTAAAQILDRHPDVRHVYLASGSCIPLRPAQELIQFLSDQPDTDFIESARVEDVTWTVGGLDQERFDFFFPFSWKHNRKLFDLSVKLQRRLKVKRRLPEGVLPHMGSQWWCLTKETLSRILNDPLRPKYDAYFKCTWIPDESYFQSLARKHTRHLESRSLTLSKFDFQGKPHLFYDDHLKLLRRSDCFVARKIWPGADKLYDFFLSQEVRDAPRATPNPDRIDRVFSRALQRRLYGRPGLYMQSRFPSKGRDFGLTAQKYAVFEGFSELFEDFEIWLAKLTRATVHGHLFAPDQVEFSGRTKIYTGGLSDSAKLRDRNPTQFLTNLIWNTRGTQQMFQYGPADTPSVGDFMTGDRNASFWIITGAWAIPLYLSGKEIPELRKQAAKLQQRELAHIEMLRSHATQARVSIWSLAEVIDGPAEPLQTMLSQYMPREALALTSMPKLHKLDGFPQFLQELKNAGMHPYLMGDFASNDNTTTTAPKPRPYRRRT